MDKQTEALARSISNTNSVGYQFGKLNDYNTYADDFLGINFKGLFKKKNKGSEDQQPEQSEDGPKLHRQVLDLEALGMGMKGQQKLTGIIPKAKNKPAGYSAARDATRKSLLGSIIDVVGSALTGDSSEEANASQWTPEAIANAKGIQDVIIPSNRSLYSKNEKTVFYVIIGILLLITIILIIKKTSKK